MVFVNKDDVNDLGFDINGSSMKPKECVKLMMFILMISCPSKATSPLYAPKPHDNWTLSIEVFLAPTQKAGI